MKPPLQFEPERRFLLSGGVTNETIYKVRVGTNKFCVSAKDIRESSPEDAGRGGQVAKAYHLSGR
jgi:hypothetical protein